MPRGIANRLRVAALLLGLTAAAPGCSSTPSSEQCKALLDHVVGLEVADSGAGKELSADMKADLDKQRKELEGYVGEQFVKRCLDSLPVAFVECGLAAKSKAEYAECEKQQ